MKIKFIITSIIVLLISSFLIIGCSGASTAPINTNAASAKTVTDISTVESSLLDTTDIFTERDLEQTADLTEAEYISLVSGEDVTIDKDGVYVLSGEVSDATIIVNCDNDAKVQLVLDGLNIENKDAPAIYVKLADKVFITTTNNSDNALSVTGTYTADGETSLDAVIFSKDDIILNGSGTLVIISSKGNGITSKDDLKLTGGTYIIDAHMDGLEANDSIRIAGGDITITAGEDAIHSENTDDSSIGYVYIVGGILDITSGDDAIRGTNLVQIDGGTVKINKCTEGIEATRIQMNDGTITIYATDDGINASAKSSGDLVVEINGGSLDITMANGDTDAIDSNGDIYINGGIVCTVANSSFDPNGVAELNGGTVTVNGEAVTELPISQMGGGMGGHGGLRPRR